MDRSWTCSVVSRAYDSCTPLFLARRKSCWRVNVAYTQQIELLLSYHVSYLKYKHIHLNEAATNMCARADNLIKSTVYNGALRSSPSPYRSNFYRRYGSIHYIWRTRHTESVLLSHFVYACTVYITYPLVRVCATRRQLSVISYNIHAPSWQWAIIHISTSIEYIKSHNLDLLSHSC